MGGLLAATRFNLLRAYFLARRGLGGSIRPETRRMRELRDAFYLEAWQRSAAKIGVGVIRLSDKVAEITDGRRRLRVSANTTSLDDPVTLLLAGDKPAVHRLLTQSGIPVPPHLVLEGGGLDEPEKVLRVLQKPLVVKPAADTGAGAGVSTNVSTPAALRRAVAWARAFSPRVLVEAQVDGDCYRVLILDGEVIDTVLRRPPSVVGDGLSSIRQLVARENKLRLIMGTERAQVLIRRDPDLLGMLREQGLRLWSRPAKDHTVILKKVINDNRGDENEAANGRLCPAILSTARLAARTLGLRLAGVDVICRDPSQPLEKSGGVIIDVNASPGFHYHYHRKGGCFPAADHILRHVFGDGVVHGAPCRDLDATRSIEYEH